MHSTGTTSATLTSQRTTRSALRRLVVLALGTALVAPAAAYGDKMDDHGPEDITARPTVAAAELLPGAYRFSSFPDFLNQDVADVTRLPGYRPGSPNGTHASYEASISHVLSEIADFAPEAFLVAGDLVEGSWGLDRTDSGTFGPIRTVPQRRAAVQVAAQTYYDAWMERVGEHGLTPYAAVGDHEMGDNPWRPGPSTPDADWIDFKRNNLGLWKGVFARHIVEPLKAAAAHVRTTPAAIDRTGGLTHPATGSAAQTAYAVRLHRDMLLVSLDVFRLNRDRSDVEVSLDPAQLAWLGQVLRRAEQTEIPWVVVQGHTPIVGPVRTRYSSRLAYDQGRTSPLWRLMRDHGVDVYLSGEVHDHTATMRDGILQVSHGGLFYRGESSYLNGQVTSDRMVLEARQFAGDPRFDKGLLWSTEGGNGPAEVYYREPSRVVGTVTLTRRRSGLNTMRATGVAQRYRP